MIKKVDFYRLLLAGLLLACLVGQASAADAVNAQAPGINLSIEQTISDNFPAVRVDLSVTDVQSAPVLGLTKENFTLSEDGKPVTGFTLSTFKNFDQPLAVILAIDTSGSMQGEALERSVAAAKDFLGSLSDQDLVGVVAFADSVSRLQELSPDRAATRAALDGLAAGGATAMYDALVETVDMLKERAGRRVVLLLTDGRDSGAGTSRYTFDETVNEAARWAVPVYPIGFGEVDQAELEKMAALTGGFAQVKPDSSALTDAFQAVLTKLREQYRLEYTSALPADAAEHELSVGLTYQNAAYTAAGRFIALPGKVTLTLKGLAEGQVVGGTVLFAPEVLAPAATSKLVITIDGQPLADVLAAPYQYAWDATGAAPGRHAFLLQVVDQAGNRGELALNLEVRPPVIVTLPLAADEVVSGVVKLAAGVDALAGIAKVEFFLDDTLLGEAAAAPYELEWNTADEAPGYHELRVRASDVNGFSGESQVRVNVEMQKSSNLLWLALLAAAAAAGVIIPLALRRRRRMRATEAAPQAAAAGAAGGTGYFVLRESEGLNPGQVWGLTADEVRLGRKRDENDIVLKGLGASRQHALLRRSGSGYTIQTVKAENPVLVNGSPVYSAAQLRAGDVIQAGESAFTYDEVKD